MAIAQDHAKSCENERLNIKKRFSELEESYKRDSELFRLESMKRDQDVEEEKAKFETEIQKVGV